ncbi:hypothetical protein ACSSS7_006275 [Eimeria intestinalis]
MLQSLWKSLSSWGDLPANFPYTLGPAVPYGFELPGGFVQFYATRSKSSGGSEAGADACRKQPILDSLINPSKCSPVSIFAFKRDKHQGQQRQQQQQLAAKRPSALPPPSSSSSGDDIKKVVEDTFPEASCYAAAAAAAADAAAAASSSCWNLLELIGALSFLNDQCNLAHGEVSPFSFFVTPHASAKQGWAPPRPPPGARPDTLDRWGLCSVFAWWLDSRRDPYSVARFSRGGGSTGGPNGASIGGPNGFSIGLDEETLRQAMVRLPSQLQQLLQQISSATVESVPLSKLSTGENPCFAGNLLKCILSLVVPPPPPTPTSSNGGIPAKDQGSTVALRLLAEVLARAFDSSDRAIRFTLLTQLPSVQEMLPDGFYLSTFDSLILGLEDSAPPIRAATARCLALYASRLPPDSPSAASIFPLLEQRLRDVVGGVRLEAVAAAAAAAKEQQQQQQQQQQRQRLSPSLVQIFSAALRDPEDTVKIAGSDSSAFLARRSSASLGTSATGAPPSTHGTPSRGGPTHTPGQQQQGPPPPPPPVDSMSPLSRSADEFKDARDPGISWGRMEGQQRRQQQHQYKASPGRMASDAPTGQRGGPSLLGGRGASAGGLQGPSSMYDVKGEALSYQQPHGGGLTPGMRLQVADTGPRLSLVGSGVGGAACLSPGATNGVGVKKHTPGAAAAALDASTDDFFAALEREAAERNL